MVAWGRTQYLIRDWVANPYHTAFKNFTAVFHSQGLLGYKGLTHARLQEVVGGNISRD